MLGSGPGANVRCKFCGNTGRRRRAGDRIDFSLPVSSASVVEDDGFKASFPSCGGPASCGMVL
eukprot:365431-Chlamydomonas_euryale.AAC.30